MLIFFKAKIIPEDKVKHPLSYEAYNPKKYITERIKMTEVETNLDCLSLRLAVAIHRTSVR